MIYAMIGRDETKIESKATVKETFICYYCGNAKDSAERSLEHIIPSSVGQFTSTMRLLSM